MNTLSIGKGHTIWIIKIRKIAAIFNLCKILCFIGFKEFLTQVQMDLLKINASIL